MEVSCVFGRESYHAGGILVALVRISYGSAGRDTVLLAQASGHIHLDPKWVKSNDSSTVSFVQTPGFPFDQTIPTPHVNAQNEYCVFLTPREVLSTTQISENGVFLMFSLPNNLIPTYKGLSGTVTYSITLTLQSQGGTIQLIKYPFTLLGGGSITVPYEIKLSSLAVFGACSIPHENLFLPELVNDSDDENDATNSSGTPINGVMYNIRDKGLICSLSMVNDGEALHPGSLLTICLSFEESVQPCRSVRAYVQQCENRTDGSRVQDKIIVEANRSVDGAVLVYLRLHLPENTACTFATPLFKVCYHIVLEFYLDGCESCLSNSNSAAGRQSAIESSGSIEKLNDGKNSEPFTWNLPIEINISRYPVDIAAEVNACLDPISEFIQSFS